MASGNNRLSTPILLHQQRPSPFRAKREIHWSKRVRKAISKKGKPR